VGKVANDQVAVFAALSNNDQVGLLQGSLYLPNDWVKDTERCTQAGILKDDQVYRTKPELAIEILKTLPASITYDWVGGDSIYGNSLALRQYLYDKKQVFVKASSENRDMWKAKCLLAQSKLVKFERTSRVVNSEQLDLSGIKGHKFTLKVVTFCVMLYVFGGCIFRSVHKVLGCFQSEYGLFLGDLPSKASIENLVQKLGYSEYTHSGNYLFEGDYVIIIDESMVVGQQLMMFVLGVDAVKLNEKALCFGTVRLLYIAVRPLWNWEDVVKLLDKVAEKMGKKPVYVISDGGNNLTKGIKEAELKRIPDVGHQIAKYVEQTYAHQ
jgi:hypothetical protein